MSSVGLLPDMHNCGLRMRRECRECFPRHWFHWFERKPLVSDPGMHHDTCVTHVSWCMSGSLTSGVGENVPGACTTHNVAYLVRGPWGNGFCHLCVHFQWQEMTKSMNALYWSTQNHHNHHTKMIFVNTLTINITNLFTLPLVSLSLSSIYFMYSSFLFWKFYIYKMTPTTTTASITHPFIKITPLLPSHPLSSNPHPLMYNMHYIFCCW